MLITQQLTVIASIQESRMWKVSIRLFTGIVRLVRVSSPLSFLPAFLSTLRALLRTWRDPMMNIVQPRFSKQVNHSIAADGRKPLMLQQSPIVAAESGVVLSFTAISDQTNHKKFFERISCGSGLSAKRCR